MIYNKPRDMELQTPALKFDTAVAKHKKQRQNTSRELITKAAVFFALLYIGTFIAFIIPLRPSYSASEKRNLKEFPAFSAEALASGDFFDGITVWFSDTFPFRENLTRLNTALQSLSGFSSITIHGDVEAGDDIPDVPLTAPETTPAVTEKPTEPLTTMPVTTEAPTEAATAPPTTQKPTEPAAPTTEVPKTTSAIDKNITQTMGAILVAGNSGYEYYNFSSSLAPRFIQYVNNIKPCSQNKSNVYTVLVPTSIDIMLNDAVRAEVNSSSQQKALEYFNSSFRDVTAVNNIFDTLRAHNNEYIYFRTDHHWTALGAYYAYTCFAGAKGIAPVSLDCYEQKSFDGFLGSFYSSSGQSPALGKTPDTVIAYMPFSNAQMHFTQTDGQTISWPVISDVSSYNANGKYLAFIAGDQPYEIIENADIPEGESCLVIKESYGNAFVPFLIPHYKTVHVIDPRHFNKTLSEFLAENPVDDIIFVANISTTRNSVYIDAMEKFIK